MNWDTDISDSAKETMKFLGNFGPTVRGRNVKGYMSEDGEVGKVYLHSYDLREVAAGCIEVADWLDKRVEE